MNPLQLQLCLALKAALAAFLPQTALTALRVFTFLVMGYATKPVH